MQSPAFGFLRLAISVPGRQTPTPGELVQVIQSAGLPLDDLGPVQVDGSDAYLDVRETVADRAYQVLSQVAKVRVLQRRWQWLKLLIGRNDGFTMNRLKKLLTDIDAGPPGRIQLNNTHTMVGVLEAKTAGAVERLAAIRINGRPVRHELLPPGMGPGDPTFTPGAVVRDR